MLSGTALFVGTLLFYLATAGYFCIINNVFCPYEESKLSQQFAERYIAYKSRVRRWL